MSHSRRQSDADAAPWRMWIDTGGTFTDCVAVDPGGRRHRLKMLSSGCLRARIASIGRESALTLDADWIATHAVRGFLIRRGGDERSSAARVIEQRGAAVIVEPELPVDVGDMVELYTGEPAPIVAARLFTGAPPPWPLPPVQMRLATTRGTNALLERAVAPTAFFVTRGFGDLLLIGDQRRPNLFELDIRRPAPLYSCVIEVDERVSASGDVLTPIDLDGVRVGALRALESGCRAAAIALMHSWRNPAHERALGAALRELGFEHVTASSELSAEAKLLPRARTAVVNAALAPIVGAFLESVEVAARGRALHVMTSAGGLKASSRFQPVDGLLSGPAGGVIGAAHAASRAGARRVITLDMGGTSTDVSRIDGAPELVFEHTVGDATLLSPALRIETVAAGGGSICGFDNRRPFVGPRSAGASPGPACYGAGGPLTVTDVNLLLGRIHPAHFGVPVDTAAAERALDDILPKENADPHAPERERLLQGFLDIANEHMAAAIRRTSVRHGYDPAEYTLVAFGGAGPQHACAVAQRLGCPNVLIPPDASLLSAHGLGAARLMHVAQRPLLTPYDAHALDAIFSPLEMEAIEGLAEQGASRDAIELERLLELRALGQAFSITVNVDGGAPPHEAFRRRHESIFGFAPLTNELEMVAARVVAQWSPHGIEPDAPPCSARATDAPKTARAWFGAWRDVPVRMAPLPDGETVAGPALILHAHTVTVIEPGWTAYADAHAGLRLHYSSSAESPPARKTTPTVVRSELITHRLESIAEQMGAALQRAALSTNVKERLDYSCAVLNPAGEVVVSAPHIPVHLGALGHCVREVMRALPLEPGDVIVTNHPAYGGSHLPDVTVIAPVHTTGGALIGFTASRAHHAEIGGVRPGSMAPDATALIEEGVVIPPTYLVRRGVTDWSEIVRLLTQSTYPTRALLENQSDLMAALSAARHAHDTLCALVDECSLGAVHEAMEATLTRTERAVRAALAQRAPAEHSFAIELDDGSPITASIRIEPDVIALDFTGSAPAHPGALNTPPAVVRSAIAYVLRLMIDAPVTINDGLLRPLHLIAPPGMLNPPFTKDAATCPAVAGGNVETSQRLVNALVRTLGLGADSQGTMNNFIIGGEGFSYYETLAGGAGATASAPGAHAVHTHMTNTAITDPEIFEIRYPVRVTRTQIRRGSGGVGLRPGGDGLLREIEFLAPTTISLLTQNRVRGPRGANGGGAGAPGAQRIIRKSGATEPLGAIDGADATPSDRIIIETPGGGAWGGVERSLRSMRS